ncbi:MAG: hypothetical protein IIU23_07685, partial [Bacteroidales bacterium]|nr:hypothetical protein [Bacteroidales bacterium]
MARHLFKYVPALCAAALLAASCGAARQLENENATYLSKNEVKFTERTPLKVSQITPYLKQQPSGLQIFQKNRVEFSPELVDASVQSIKDHLEYLGYYNSSVEPVITEKDKWKKVVYYITPGTRYKIKEIRFKLPQGTSLEADFLDDVENISV